ncbi:M48 family metallopeptidase [Singulisphaera sp. Ch08]|uniref:M48 family metallopeptidase n=1 Tax=Singulisphaera sp. Ch08 TaxID=3120278 RepID=A0AAU7CDU0_9BACT
MSYGGYYGPSNENRGPNLRIIGAIIIAVISIGIYSFQTQVNPVTGKTQHIAISSTEEKALGLQAAPEMAAQMGGRIDPSRDLRARLVHAVGRRLVERSDASRSEYVDNYNFYLLNDPETINAFALPGGQIFITLGLMEKMTNEAQLAGVLGHEIGHVVGRHSAAQMAKGRLGQLLTLAVGVGASGEDDNGRKAQMVAAMVNQVTQLRFSREDESEADTFGLRYMAQAGYDPSAMLDVMRILKAASQGSRQPEFLATHPLPETRLQEIESILTQEYPNGIPSNLIKGVRLEDGQPVGR